MTNPASGKLTTRIIPVSVEDKRTIYVQATVLGGEQDIAVRLPSFEGVSDAIEGIAKSLTRTMEKVKPRKATVEFGLELAVESGKLTALLVKGSGTASLTVTLEWGGDPQKE